ALLALAGLFAPLARPEAPSPEPEPIWPKTSAANRARSRVNMKKLGIAFFNFESQHGYFPPAVAYSKGKKPLLSWRVAILPSIGEGRLYKEFKLDGPWDSPHNKKLIARMPRIYAPPIEGKPAKEGHTYYQVFTGKSTPFGTGPAPSGQGPALVDYKDG